MSTFLKRFSLVAILLALVVMIGCGQSQPNDPQGKNGSTEQDKKVATHQHGEWWCPEHGIPEHECSMCSIEYAEKCKAKGDWCEKHDRAKSQCFICDPSLKEKFAAKYRAKYGKEPPPITEDLKK